jgi:hypothetical protein
MAYQYIWTPDPMPPQSQGPYQPIQQVYVPAAPPLPPNHKTPKPGKGLSYKRAKKISDDWLKILSEVEEAKKKGKPDQKKKEGLNWVELSLMLIFVSIPIACIELGMAYMLIHLIPFK